MANMLATKNNIGQLCCKCKGGCNDRRCACFKGNQGCNQDCQCSNCRNPLNGLDVGNLPICTMQNIKEYTSLTPTQLDKEYLLPCECEQVSLKNLIEEYECSNCGEIYWYSFCWHGVIASTI